jgi:hypothetical protein
MKHTPSLCQCQACGQTVHNLWTSVKFFVQKVLHFFNEKIEKGTGASAKEKEKFIRRSYLFKDRQSLALDRVSVGLVPF